MAGFAAFCAAVVVAQSVAAQKATPPSAAPCEFHVWPGSSLGSVYYGWVGSGINNGAVKGRAGYPKVPASPLDTPVQAELLKETQPQRLLGHSSDHLIVHVDALPSRVARTTAGRIEVAAGPCYAELVVDGVMLRQDIVNGSFLQILFRYRDFGTGDAPQHSFGTWVKTALSKTDGDSEAVTREIREAYKTNVALFARSLPAAPARP